jgi:hypothetical protein
MAFRIACLAALLCTSALAAPPPVIREALTREDVKAHKVRLEESYDNAQKRCRRVQGVPRELCNERARADRDVQLAELELQAAPTPANDRRLRQQKAEAAYAIALVQCKTMEGVPRDVCRRDARTVYNDAKAEAKLQNDVAAPTLLSENAVRERTAVSEKLADAQFAAARTRCEMLPPEGRENCLSDARKRYGKF